MRCRELCVFLVLLVICDVESRDYVIESWKSLKVVSSFFVFFLNSKVDVKSFLIEIW